MSGPKAHKEGQIHIKKVNRTFSEEINCPPVVKSVEATQQTEAARLVERGSFS
jgi:hypothetical protein